MAALASHRQQTSANVVRLLLLTGARRGEVLSATWDQFDLATGVWTKLAARTKQKKLHRVLTFLRTGTATPVRDALGIRW